jgi:hypothetical protein
MEAGVAIQAQLPCPMQRATTFFTICHQWLFFLTLLVALEPLPHAQIIGHWQASLWVNGDPLHPMPACTVAVAFVRTRRTLHGALLQAAGQPDLPPQ